MSWKVANLCAERKFGSPVRKQIIMFLADKASDDGSGIWCSKATIQRHTELGESTVKRTINEFLKEGILVEAGRRPCKSGFTVIYRLMLGKVEELEPVSESGENVLSGTGTAPDGVRSEPGRGSAPAGEGGPQRTPNHPKTIQKPPSRASTREAEEDLDFERIWKAYPEDRRRGKAASLALYHKARNEGASVQKILDAVTAYAQQSSGYTRTKVRFADNWFKNARWRSGPKAAPEAAARPGAHDDAHLEKLAGWIRESPSMFKYATDIQRRVMLARGMVSREQARRAGVSL